MTFVLIAAVLFIVSIFLSISEFDPVIAYYGAIIAFVIFLFGTGLASESEFSQEVKKTVVALETLSPGIYASLTEDDQVIVRYNGRVHVLDREFVEIKTGPPKMDILDSYGDGVWTYFDGDDKYVVSLPPNGLSY